MLDYEGSSTSARSVRWLIFSSNNMPSCSIAMQSEYASL